MTSKILDVLEAVAIHGPATLDEITGNLPRTRSSVYRALIELEKNEWINRSLNGRDFMLSSKMEDLIVKQFTSSKDVFDVVNALGSVSLKCQIMIAVHVKGSIFNLADTNAYPLPSTVECPYILAAMINLISVMRRYRLICGPLIENHTESQQKTLIELGKNGFIIVENIETCILPLQTRSDEMLFVICSHKNFSRSGLSFIEDAADQVYGAVSTLGRTFKQFCEIERSPEVLCSRRPTNYLAPVQRRSSGEREADT